MGGPSALADTKPDKFTGPNPEFQDALNAEISQSSGAFDFGPGEIQRTWQATDNSRPNQSRAEAKPQDTPEKKSWWADTWVVQAWNWLFG